MPRNRAGIINRHIAEPGGQLQWRIRRHFPSQNHPIQPAGFTCRLQLRGHITDAKMVVKLKARRARLRDLNQRIAPAKNVADKDVFLGQTLGRQILTKCWRNKKLCLLGEFPRPVRVVLARIMAQRALRPAVDFFLGLLIPRQT
ncbi:hypothetical protein D3C76_1456840 [compost metagenome]